MNFFIKFILKYFAKKQFYKYNPHTIKKYLKVFRNNKDRVCQEFEFLLSIQKLVPLHEEKIFRNIVWKFIKKHGLKSDTALSLIERYVFLLLDNSNLDCKNLIEICKYILTIVPPTEKSTRLAEKCINFLSTEEKYKQLLLNVCKYILKEDPNNIIALNHMRSPYILGLPVSSSNMFFGRDQLINKIMRGVLENSYLILGKRRIGKTSFLISIRDKMIQSNMNNPSNFLLPVFKSLETIQKPDDFFKAIMREILENLQKTDTAMLRINTIEEGKRKKYSSDDFKHDIKKIIVSLKNQNEKRIIIVLLLDELDFAILKYGKPFPNLLRGVLFSTLADSLRVIGTAKTNIDLTAGDATLSPWYNTLTFLYLHSLSEKEAEDLITEPVKGIYKYNRDAINMIREYSDKEPLIIQHLCSLSVENALSDHRFEITGNDVNISIEKLLTTESLGQKLGTVWKGVLSSEQKAIILETVKTSNEDLEEQAIHVLNKMNKTEMNMYFASMVTELPGKKSKLTSLFKEWVKRRGIDVFS